VRRIAEFRTELASQGSDDDPSGAATSHTTNSSAITETNAPPRSSNRCAVRLLMALRSRVPTKPASACPATARPKIAPSEMSTRRESL